MKPRGINPNKPYLNMIWTPAMVDQARYLSEQGDNSVRNLAKFFKVDEREMRAMLIRNDIRRNP